MRAGCGQAVGLVVRLASEGAMVPAMLSLPARGTGVRGCGVEVWRVVNVEVDGVVGLVVVEGGVEVGDGV